MFKSSSAILVGSLSALRDIPAAYRERTRWLPENAIDPARFNRSARPSGSGPLRACFIGRVVPCKGVEFAIRGAAPLLASGRVRFDIIGDGPEVPRLSALATELEVAEAVVFHGWKTHAEVQEIASQSQILLFPSIREFGGGAVLEAMALGLVPVVADYGGPAELVTAETGFKLPIDSREGLVAGIEAVLYRLAAEPKLLSAMGEAARSRVAVHFTWQARARQIEKVYAAVLAGTPLPQPLPCVA